MCKVREECRIWDWEEIVDGQKNKNLLKRLEVAFGNTPRPSSLVEVSGQYRKRYESEFDQLDLIDWDNVSPHQLDGVYEPSTYISPEAFRYLLPYIFRFCTKWPSEAVGLDFISVFIRLPYITHRIGEMSGYTDEEKLLVQEFAEYLNDKLDLDIEEVSGPFA